MRKTKKTEPLYKPGTDGYALKQQWNHGRAHFNIKIQFSDFSWKFRASSSTGSMSRVQATGWSWKQLLKLPSPTFSAWPHCPPPPVRSDAYQRPLRVLEAVVAFRRRCHSAPLRTLRPDWREALTLGKCQGFVPNGCAIGDNVSGAAHISPALRASFSLFFTLLVSL